MTYKIKKSKPKAEKESYEVESDSDFSLIKQGYEDGEWADQFYTYHFIDEKNNAEVVLSVDSIRSNVRYSVVYDGAVDYEGNSKKELLKRYPEFKEVLK